MPLFRLLPLAALLLGLVACSGGEDQKPTPLPPGTCLKNLDCPTGQGCADKTCVPLPCGGLCSRDEVCVAGACLQADGVACAHDPGVCPRDYLCTPQGDCQLRCDGDDDCLLSQSQRICNLSGPDGYCGECAFDGDCKADPERTRCDAAASRCVGCLKDLDCRSGALGVGLYCEPESRTCQQGCNGDDDCAAGRRCAGASASAAGRCIECDSDAQCDFSDGGRRCHPDRGVCVQCLGDAWDECDQCHLQTNECVECLTNAWCVLGHACDPATFECGEGCAGGIGAPNCGTSKVCDPSRGARGACVDCLRDADCPRAHVCDASGASPKCVPGCKDDLRCQGQDAVDPFCHSALKQCVQCRSTADCPGTSLCETATGMCRCKKEGEACDSDDECGYRVLPGGVTDCDAPRHVCVSQVRCGGTSGTVKQVARVCTVAGLGQTGTGEQCPAGFVNETAAGPNGTFTRQCVPSSYKCF